MNMFSKSNEKKSDLTDYKTKTKEPHTNIHTCDVCNGSGYAEAECDRCDTCKENKLFGCIMCKGGFKKYPYETCMNCNGTGEISH